MKLREALIQQAPSLALQRAASDEISSLDHEVKTLEEELALAHAHYSLAMNFILQSGLEDEYEEWVENLTETIEVH